MDLELQNKSALVTGASRGIGLGIATALKGMGCRLMLNARGAERLQAQAQRLGDDVLWHGADVRDPVPSRVIQRHYNLDTASRNAHAVRPPGGYSWITS